MASRCAVLVSFLLQHHPPERHNYSQQSFEQILVTSSKFLADISLHSSLTWVSTKDAVLRKASYPSY